MLRRIAALAAALVAVTVIVAPAAQADNMINFSVQANTSTPAPESTFDTSLRTATSSTNSFATVTLRVGLTATGTITVKYAACKGCTVTTDKYRATGKPLTITLPKGMTHFFVGYKAAGVSGSSGWQAAS